MLVQNLSQLLLKVSSSVQHQTCKLFYVIFAEDCCSVNENSQQDTVILCCVMCLTPRHVTAGLPILGEMVRLLFILL